MLVFAILWALVSARECYDAQSCLFEQRPSFNITSFGAVGDGVTMNTKAIQATIAYAAAEGGGNVVVPAGRFLSGGIVLESNTYLLVESDGVLLASTSIEDYPSNPALWVLVLAMNASFVGISGSGVIDGQAVPAWVDYYDGLGNKLIPKTWNGSDGCSGECRPRLVQFIFSQHVTVTNITLTNSPDWTSHYYGCNDVLIDSVTVLGNSQWPNNDGIDPESSQNVVIRNSYVDTGDDGICLKSTLGAGVVSNVTVSNCTIRSRSSAIKFGSNTDMDMFDILFEDITIWDSNRGLGIQQRSGGNIYNVIYRNINIETRCWTLAWWGAGEPIWVTSVARSSTSPSAGVISNIQYINITARAENAAFIAGRPFEGGNPISDISFNNVSVTIFQWTNYTCPYYDWRPSVSPDIQITAVPAFSFESTHGATFTSSAALFAVPRQKYWASCLATKDSTDIDATELSCYNGSTDV